MFSVKLDRTDLRISLSRAKFDVEADFDVRLAVGRPKPHLLGEKRNFAIQNFCRKLFLGVEKSKNETLGIV